MRSPIICLLAPIVVSVCACSIKKDNSMSDKIKGELTKIDSLLRDAKYNEEMAKALDAAYYKGIRKEAPPFLAAGEDTATKQKSLKEEKIATNVAGFYALECGIWWLCSQSNQTPVEWLNKIKNNSVDSATISILNRFANAAWKAGQPFRGMERIARPAFTVFNFLPQDEIKKDEGNKAAFFNRGVAHWVTSDTANACRDWSAVSCLNGHHLWRRSRRFVFPSVARNLPFASGCDSQ